MGLRLDQVEYLEGAVEDLREEVAMHQAYIDDVLTDMRNLVAYSLSALGWYGRIKGRVIPEMEGLAIIVNGLGDKPEYYPKSWCWPEKNHHVTPHKGCILR